MTNNTLTEIKIDGRFLDFRADYYDVDSDILNEIDEEELDYWDVDGFGCHLGANLKKNQCHVVIEDDVLELNEIRKFRIIKEITSSDFLSDEQKKAVKEHRKSTIGMYQSERRRYFSEDVGDMVEVLATIKGDALFEIETKSPFKKENLFILSMDLLGYEDIELLHSFGYLEDDGSITWSETGTLGDHNTQCVDYYVNEVYV
jgi:hypothetical protein